MKALRHLFAAVASVPALASAVAVQALRATDNLPVAEARVTLFTPDLLFFREARTDTNGMGAFSLLGEGEYRLGVTAMDFDYQEITVAVTDTGVTQSFTLVPESQPGRWNVIGNTSPELIDGTGSGTLLPTGEFFMCHDAKDPVCFSALSNFKWLPGFSGSEQGCHITTLTTDGRLFLAGGSMGGNPLDPVVKVAKAFDRTAAQWSLLPPMNIGRWYPGIVRLPDERLMILSGELNNPGYGRTPTCEIFDPQAKTWTLTGSMSLPTEIPPTVLMSNGEAFKSWRYPEIYNPASGQWRPAARMVQSRKGAEGGGHCDHELIHLQDGRLMALGVSPTTLTAYTRFSEFYDPATDSWSLGPNPRYLRTQPEAAMLLDGRVLSFGGTYSGSASSKPITRSAGQVPDCTQVADLYDPARNVWRPLANLKRFVHYHSVTLVVPDGRVINFGGAGGGSLFGDDSSIEAYEPPYLFRGVRPRIDTLSTHDLVQGGSVTLHVSFAERVTSVLLLGTRAATHWVDGGVQRALNLDFTQHDDEVTVQIPADPSRALAGWYLLSVRVDEVPSMARMVRVLRAGSLAPGLSRPTVMLTSDDAALSEGGLDLAHFTVTRDRTGTNGPLTVQLAFAGTALNGADCLSVANFVTFPKGVASITVKVTPTDDALAEGDEHLDLRLLESPAYRVTGDGVRLTIADNDTTPPALTLALPNAGELRLAAAASRLLRVESSTDLTTWLPLTTLPSFTGTTRLTGLAPTNWPALFLRARINH